MNCPFCRYSQSETYIRILNPPQYMLPRQQTGGKPTLEQAQQMDMQEFKNQVLAELRSELQPKIASIESLNESMTLESQQQSKRIEELCAQIQTQSSQQQIFERKVKQTQSQYKENLEALQLAVLQQLEQLKKLSDKQQQQQELLLKLQLKQKECAKLQLQSGSHQVAQSVQQIQTYVDSKLSDHSAKLNDVVSLYNQLTNSFQESLQNNQDLNTEVEALQSSVDQLKMSVQQSLVQSDVCSGAQTHDLESPMVYTNVQVQKQRPQDPQVAPARIVYEQERDQVVQYINTSAVKQRSLSPQLAKNVANPRSKKIDQELQTSNISTRANEAQTSYVSGQDVCLQRTNSSSPHSVVHLSDQQSQRTIGTSSYQQSQQQRWQNTVPDSGSGTATSTNKIQQQQQILNQSRSSNLSSPQKYLQFSESQIPIAQKVYHEYGRASQSNYYSRFQPSGQVISVNESSNQLLQQRMSNQNSQQQVLDQQSHQLCSSDQLNKDFPVVDRVVQSDNYRHKQVLSSTSQQSSVQQQFISQHSNMVNHSENPQIDSKICGADSLSKKSDITKSNSGQKSGQLVSQQRSANSQQTSQQSVAQNLASQVQSGGLLPSAATKEQNQFQYFIEEQQQLHNSIASLHSENNELPPRPADPEQLKYSRIEQKLQQRQEINHSNQLTTAAFDLSQKPVNQTGITPSLLQTVKPLNVYEINQKQQQLMSKVDQAYIDLQPVQSINSSIRFEEYEPRQSLQSD